MIRDMFANEVEDECLAERRCSDLGQMFSFNDPEYRFVCRSTVPVIIDYSEDELSRLARDALASNLSITRDSNVQDYRGERFYFETFTYRFVDIAQHFNSLTVHHRDRNLPDLCSPRPVYLIFTVVFDLNATLATFKKSYITVVINK